MLPNLKDPLKDLPSESLPHTKKNYNYISIRAWKSSFNNNNNYNSNTTCPEVTWIKYSNTQQYSFPK